MFQGLRKITKKNIIREAILGTPPTLSGAIFNYGRIGSGKTTAMLSLAQKYRDVLNYKIIDLHGGERNEQHYWALPSRDYTYWMKVKKHLRLSNEGPKQYKVHFLYPCFKGMRTKLPQNTPFIQSSVFTIPFKDITIDDISLVVGTSATTNEYFWREALEMCKDKHGPAYLDKAFHSLKGANTSIYKNFVKPLTDARLLSSKRDDYNIDLISEIRDRETIMVICLDFVPKEYKLFIMGWMLRQLSLLLDLGKIHNKNIVMIREAAEFFRATDTSILPEKYKIFRVQLSNHIRYGRKGVHCFLDCQSPSETRGLVDGSQDLTLFGRLTSEADKSAGLDQLKRDGLVSSKQVADISILDPGQYYVAESGKRVKKRYFFLPRSMYWKKEYGNFFDNVWRTLVNKWVDVTTDVENIDDKYKAEKHIIVQEQKEKEAAEKRKKQEKDSKKQEEADKKLEDTLMRKELIKIKVQEQRDRIKQKALEKKNGKKTKVNSEIEVPEVKEEPVKIQEVSLKHSDAGSYQNGNAREFENGDLEKLGNELDRNVIKSENVESIIEEDTPKHDGDKVKKLMAVDDYFDA
jgi:hypothetical protein